MKVAIDAHCLGSGQGGDETMMKGLLAGLAQVCEDDDRFEVYLGADGELPTQAAADERFRVARNLRRLPGALHFPLRMPLHYHRDLRGGGVDLHFGPNHMAVSAPVPAALMLQDLTYFDVPETFPWIHRQRFQQIAPRQARAAAAVLTVSDHCRAEIVERLKLPDEKVFTVPNNIAEPPPFSDDDRLDAEEWLKGLGVDGPFVLYLGNIHKRKNVPRLIKAFSQARRECPDLTPYRLVVAGASWWGAGDEERSAVERPDDVVFLGRVSDERREALMRIADALLYVSLSEGFGLPPLEAMVRGTPALVSNTTSLPEVVGDAALQVDPTDTEAIAGGIVRILTDDDLRADLIPRGVEQARSWTLERTGRAARDAFEAAIELSRR